MDETTTTTMHWRVRGLVRRRVHELDHLIEISLLELEEGGLTAERQRVIEGAVRRFTEERRDLREACPAEFEIVDEHGRRLEVGDRVILPGIEPDGSDATLGRITDISDPDGDADDEGRPIGINPKVEVRFGPGDTDEFSTGTTWDTHNTGTFVCDELLANDPEASNE